MAAEALAKSRRLLGQIQDERLKEKILEVLPQGHGSGLDADLLDGLHAAEILAKMRVFGGGGGGGVSDHSALTGLDDPADHAWAFLLDGSRAFTGNLLPSVSGSFNIGSALKKIATGFIEVVQTSRIQGDGDDLIITPDVAGAEIWIKAWDPVMGPVLVARAALGYFEIVVDKALKTNTVIETTSDAGVTVDNVLLKDGVIPHSAYPNALLLDGTRAMTGDLVFPHLRFIDVSEWWMSLKDAANTHFASLNVSGIKIWGGQISSGQQNATIRAYDTIWGNYVLQAYDTTWRECAKLYGGGGGGAEFSIARGGDIIMLDDKFLQIGKDSDGVLPAASVSYRGKLIRIEGGAGVADKTYQCLKAADDSYSWKEVAAG
jgi:hypothetical protein